MGQANIGALNDNVLGNLKGLVNADTIIGEAITTADGTMIIPVSKVSFGFAAGGSDLGKEAQNKFAGGSGGGVTVQPIAFLVVRQGRVQLLQLADKNGTAERALNLVPEVMDRFGDLFGKNKEDKEPSAESQEDIPF